MLGFSTYSETPFAQATTSSAALAFATSILTQGYVGLIDYDAKAFLLMPSASTTTVANTFGDVDAKATIAVTDAIASISINDLLDIDAQARVTPVSVSALSSTEPFQAVFGKASTSISYVSAGTTASTIDYDAKANITTGNVNATTSINSFYDVDAQATINVGAVSGIFRQNLEDPVAVQFPYSLYADQYDRSRTVYLISYDNNITSHVVSQNTTVYIVGTQESNVVHVVPENYTVYIQKLDGSNTVHIAA